MDTEDTEDDESDVVLIGGGIMSATLGAMLVQLQPGLRVHLFERLGSLAGESSDPWNNAGTGHSGFCELNYMPDPRDGSKPEEIARQFHLSRQFWASLARTGGLPDPERFIASTPHMDVVFGEKDVAYLRERFRTLVSSPLFAAMEYTEDPATIRRWAPLLVDGRADGGPMAATRYPDGTDVDFGALTRMLVAAMERGGATVRVGHEVTALSRRPDGRWEVRGREAATGHRFRIRSRFVFVGAGGYALRLLQRARVPEVRGYGVFPLGAQFLRCDNPAVVARHEAKVYSQAAIGAPPMSVPHLDRRVVDGQPSLLFGPYATFSTKLLKHGRWSDLFRTLQLRNLPVLLSAGAQNLPLVRYLIGQLLASRATKLRELRRFVPAADPADWRLIQAGQRAQLIKPDRRHGGVLTFGTELVASGDGTIAGLLGASPGASTAVPIMIDLLERCFPEDWARWRPELERLIPGLSAPVGARRAEVEVSLEQTAQALRLTRGATVHLPRAGQTAPDDRDHAGSVRS